VENFFPVYSSRILLSAAKMTTISLEGELVAPLATDPEGELVAPLAVDPEKTLVASPIVDSVVMLSASVMAQVHFHRTETKMYVIHVIASIFPFLRNFFSIYSMYKKIKEIKRKVFCIVYWK
jgi:hypothetical protein